MNIVQTKPLRSFGIDVTQTSMKPILDSLGITDRSINEMSQAEKQILRYIATLNQAKSAMGDFADTINCGLMLKNIMRNFVNLCKKGVNILKNIFANDGDLYIKITSCQA